MRLFNFILETKNTESRLKYLAAEAKKYATFEDFRKAFLLQIKHGLYWHVTDNPSFEIDKSKGPKDMSSLGSGNMSVGKLMITSDLKNWIAHYRKLRQYVAEIDMSDVPENLYRQVSRGFGNEFFVSDPTKAKVVGVYQIKKALQIDRNYNKSLPKSDEELRNFYISVHKKINFL